MLSPNREFGFARTAFLFSCVCSISLAIILLIRNRESWFFPVTSLVLLAATCWFSLRRTILTGRSIGLLLAIAAINFSVLVPELALRIGGFRYVSGIQWGLRYDYFTRYEPDTHLFWTLPRSQTGVNSLGMRGSEPIVPKPANTFRLLFLGDSCTYQGYPSLVRERLNAQAPLSKKIECIVLALPGYSSRQGRVLAEIYGEKLEPDLVFVYYGWNDHWLAFGSPDAQRTIHPFAENLYQSIRTVQAFRKTITFFHVVSDNPTSQMRVSIDDYRKNLMAILKVFQQSSIPVIFITAPTSHYQLGVPRYLVALKYASHKDSVTALHRAYNHTVREVAANSGAILIDLERQFEHTSDPRSLFNEDGIHFTKPDGLQVIANVLAAFVQTHFLR